MGKPFQSEIQLVQSSLDWVFTEVHPKLERVPLEGIQAAYCVGSGGSQSAADFLSRLLREEGICSSSVTPLELLSLRRPTSKTAVFLLSAGGRNKDILASFDCSKAWEPLLICGITTTSGTPLAAEVKAFARGTVVEMSVPSGRDGFLATNSLISMMSAMPVLIGHSANKPILDALQRSAAIISEGPRPSNLDLDSGLIILHAGWSGPAALDLESKLSEAALSSSMLCDLRSFGHGRHHWLAKHPATPVLALIDKGFENLFRKTLALLPKSTAIQSVTTDLDGPWAAVDLTVKVFGLVRDIGVLQSIDPGRPGVPEFGRRIYHLSPRSKLSAEIEKPAGEAFRRYREHRGLDQEVRGRLADKSSSFKIRLRGKTLCGLVLDYDGTVVDTNKRFGSIRNAVAEELVRLLRSGMFLGIATGRGKSVRESLRLAVPEEYWPSITIGYYNCSQIIPLAGALPDTAQTQDPNLLEFAKILSSDPMLGSTLCIEDRPEQLTLSSPGWSNESLCFYVLALLARYGGERLKCVMSSHSVDVIPPTVTKRALVNCCAHTARCNLEEILTIGDSGLWPGNDFELLGQFPSLSCGSQPIEVDTGWNLAPQGMVESNALLFYLKHLHVSDSGRGTMVLA